MWQRGLSEWCFVMEGHMQTECISYYLVQTRQQLTGVEFSLLWVFVVIDSYNFSIRPQHFYILLLCFFVSCVVMGGGKDL